MTDATATPPDLDAPGAPPQAAAPGIGMLLLKGLASMKLAVVLLMLLGLLTWLGTLAQIEQGLWLTQKKYFESWFLIADLELSWWGDPVLAGDDGKGFVLKIPLPGAYPVMALLFVNLLVGGLMRLKWRARNAGVLITHVGIALLLVAGFVKLEYSYSGHLSLYEAPQGDAPVAQRVHESSTFHSFHDHELALLIDEGDTIVERVVPESRLLAARDGTLTLSGDGLPFEVQVHHWLDNCQAMPKGPMVRAATPVLKAEDGGGIFLRPVDVVLTRREANNVGCYVTVLTDKGERIDSMLEASPFRLPRDGRRFPFTFTVDGKRYGLDLRRVVYDLPFKVRLDEFVKRDHPGTMTAADYRSFVTVEEGGQEREAQIYMNTPLRKDGFVVYQTSWGPQIQGRPAGGPPWYSVFEVSENPSDKWPEYACWVIAVGLLVHFVNKLLRFLNSSTRERLTS